MAQNRFREKKKVARSSGLLLPVLSFVLVLGAFFWGVGEISASAQEQQRQSLEDAVRRSATHCYVTEGAYPQSLEYLQQHYGLSWDGEKYRVEYEIFASNLCPTVRVTRLE